MKKRLLACLLCCCFLLCCLPAVASATVLPGMTSKVDYDNTDPNRYTIEIDLVNQVISVWENASGAFVPPAMRKTPPAAAPLSWGI